MSNSFRKIIVTECILVVNDRTGFPMGLLQIDIHYSYCSKHLKYNRISIIGKGGLANWFLDWNW